MWSSLWSCVVSTLSGFLVANCLTGREQETTTYCTIQWSLRPCTFSLSYACHFIKLGKRLKSHKHNHVQNTHTPHTHTHTHSHTQHACARTHWLLCAAHSTLPPQLFFFLPFPSEAGSLSPFPGSACKATRHQYAERACTLTQFLEIVYTSSGAGSGIAGPNSFSPVSCRTHTRHTHTHTHTRTHTHTSACLCVLCECEILLYSYNHLYYAR